jgi:hypothetical protein
MVFSCSKNKPASPIRLTWLRGGLLYLNSCGRIAKGDEMNSLLVPGLVTANAQVAFSIDPFLLAEAIPWTSGANFCFLHRRNSQNGQQAYDLKDTVDMRHTTHYQACLFNSPPDNFYLSHLMVIETAQAPFIT